MIKSTTVVAIKFVIRETRSMNALANLDLFWKITQLARKVSYSYDVSNISKIFFIPQTGIQFLSVMTYLVSNFSASVR